MQGIREAHKSGTPCAVFQAEMSGEEMYAMSRNLRVPDDLPIPLNNHHNGDPAKVMSMIQQFSDDNGLARSKLFLIDSAQFLGDGRASSFRKYVKEFHKLAADTSSTILFINHLSKDKNLLGSSELQFLSSGIIYLSRNQDKTGNFTDTKVCFGRSLRNGPSSPLSGFVLDGPEGIKEVGAI